MLGEILEAIWYIGGFLVIAAIVIAGVLMYIKPPVNESTIKDNTLARAYMDKNKKKYAKCKNELGILVPFAITTKYIEFETPDEQRTAFKNAEAKYKQKKEAECGSVVQEYEKKFKTLKKTAVELEKADISLLERIFGADDVSADDLDFSDYDPVGVQIHYGNGIGGNEKEASQFFKQEMGY